jgi:hypothetical protein
VPSQILLNSAKALRGHGRTFARGLTDRIPAGRRHWETKPEPKLSIEGVLSINIRLFWCPAIKSGSQEPCLAGLRRARR